MFPQFHRVAGARPIFAISDEVDDEVDARDRPILRKYPPAHTPAERLDKECGAGTTVVLQPPSRYFNDRGSGFPLLVCSLRGFLSPVTNAYMGLVLKQVHWQVRKRGAVSIGK